MGLGRQTTRVPPSLIATFPGCVNGTQSRGVHVAELIKVDDNE